MIRHVVMFRWKDETTDDDVAAIVDELRTMPELIPQIREYRFGRDLGINPATWDFVVVGDFASTEDYLIYRDDPQHQALIADKIIPAVAERASVQFETA